MPFELEDVVRVKMFQNWQGQQVLNVAHYLVSAVPPTAWSPASVVEGFGNFWFNLARTQQHNGLNYVRCEMEIIGKPDLGIYTFPAASLGNVTGEPLPPFCAFGIRQARSNKLTRNGQKRLAGVLEAQTTNGTLNTAVINAVTSIAEVLFRDPIDVPDNGGTETGVIFDPIIFGGISLAYPLGRYSFVSGVLVSPNVSTQNTRKVRTRDGL